MEVVCGAKAASSSCNGAGGRGGDIALGWEAALADIGSEHPDFNDPDGFREEQDRNSQQDSVDDPDDAHHRFDSDSEVVQSDMSMRDDETAHAVGAAAFGAEDGGHISDVDLAGASSGRSSGSSSSSSSSYGGTGALGGDLERGPPGDEDVVVCHATNKPTHAELACVTCVVIRLYNCKETSALSWHSVLLKRTDVTITCAV